MPRKPTLFCASCGGPMWSGRTSAPQGVAKCQPCRRQDGDWYRKRELGTCEKCDRPAQSRGLCRTHYSQWWRAQNPERAKKVSRDWHVRSGRSRKPCGWCGAIHTVGAGGTSLNGEGMTHVNWLRHYGAPSPSQALVVFKADTQPKRERRVPVVKSPRPTGGTFYHGACSQCGELFTAISFADPAQYCSKRCARRSIEARRGGKHFATDLLRREVYERDNYVCQICQEPTDVTADPTSNWYPSLDHIIPQSLGGGHESDNLRCAHRWCNAVRGDLRYFSDGDLAPKELANV